MKCKPFRRGSLQLRVLALTLLFTLGVLAVIVVSNVSQLNRELQRTTVQSAEYALQTAATVIRRDVEEVDDLVSWCAYSPGMRTYLLTDTSNNQALSMYPTISAKYSSMRTLPYIQRFMLVNAAGRQMMFGTATAYTMAVTDDLLRTLPGYDTTNSYTGWEQIMQDPLMLPSQATDIIPITRTVTMPGTSRTAHIYLCISPTVITGTLKSFTLAEGGRLIWEMNGQAYLVQDGSLTPLENTAEQADVQPAGAELLGRDTEAYRVGSGSGGGLLVRYPVGVHGMYLSEYIPLSAVQSQQPLLSEPMLVSLAAILLLGLSLTFLLHRMIAAPIRALQSRMEKIGGGDFSRDAAIEWDNELGDIGRGINSMAANVTALMNRRLEDEKQKQDLEYRMLQNQINPHFIYNTLNSIKWMATIQHAPGIAEMVTALSRLLKSVSKGNERLVPLYEEFALLNDYFTIQQYRYGGTITLDVSYIEDEALARQCLIPRFTLQPLVENAIFHGIEPKGCAGEVGISVRREPETGDVLIALTDDGVGMTPQQIEKALQEPGPEEAAAKYRHVGMWNVHRRLQYSFGPRYGLSIESEVGVGTVVTIRLPGSSQ